MSLTHVPVVGTFTYRDADATPAAGEKIHFLARSPAVVDGDTVTLPKKIICTLNADGEVPAGFALPTVGDGVYYDVRERFPGGRGDYAIEVLTTDTWIDLATAPQVVPVDPMVAYLTSADIGVSVASQAAATSLDARVDALEASPGGGAWGTITGTLAAQTDLQAALDGKATAAQGAKADSAIQPGDAALSDAREWTAATVTQAEAEAGTDTARKAWSVQRVWQGIAAWWAASAAKAKLDGIAAGATVGADWSTNVTNKPTLGNSAALNVGTTAGTVAAGDDARLSDARTPTAHTHTAAQISDSTAVGRSVVTAADAAAARAATGAGTVSGPAVTVAGNAAIFDSTTGVLLGQEAGPPIYCDAATGSTGTRGQISGYSTDRGNTCVGIDAGKSITSSSNVTLIGRGAGQLITSASSVVAIGTLAAYSNASSGNVTCVGHWAGYSANSSGNSLFGSLALFGVNNAVSTNNCVFGASAARYYGAGSSVLTNTVGGVYIGQDVRAGANSVTNEIVIGGSAIGSGSNTATIGNSSLTLLYTPGQLRALGSYSTTSSAAANVTIDSSGNLTRSTSTMLRKVTVPSTATSSGAVGDVAYDASYLYVCTAANTWVRAALATW